MEAQRETATQQDAGQPTLLEELLVDARVQRDDEDAYRIARQGVEAFMSELLSSRDKYGKIDRNAVDLMIAEIDERITAQINEVLHHADFQKMESTWRSIKYLVDHCDFRENVKVELIDVTKEDLIEDFEDAPEIPK